MSQLAILDDDTHTFDGKPLIRFFKMRKWCIFVSILLILISQNWFDIHTLKKNLMLSNLPDNTFHKSIWATSVYLFIQSIFLLTQVTTGYKESLGKRALLSIKSQIDDISQVIENLESNLNSLKIEFKNEEKRYRVVRNLGSPNKSSAMIAIEREQKKLSTDIEEFQNDKNELLFGNNVKRKIIQYTEISLDMIRILPTMLILSFAVLFQSPF